MLNFILASVISGVWFVGPNIDADIALCIAPKTVKCEFQRVESQRAEPKPKVTSRVLTEEEFNRLYRPSYSTPQYTPQYSMPRSYRYQSGYQSCPSCSR